MEAHRERNVLAWHTHEAHSELGLCHGEGVASVQGSIHVRIRHGCEELWVLGAQVGQDSGGDGGGIGFGNGSIAPSSLALLLVGNQGVSLVSLHGVVSVDDRSRRRARTLLGSFVCCATDVATAWAAGGTSIDAMAAMAAGLASVRGRR